MKTIATQEDIARLESLYEGLSVFYGDMHNHAATGGTSDGHRDLNHWKGALEALHMDFAAILDHRQVRHMFLPEWDDSVFICGTEPGTKITDTNAVRPYLHYNMVVPTAQDLMDVLEAFPEFEFEGGPEGHFKYPEFTRERFGQLIDAVNARGGFFVHPHPKQNMQSEDPIDYWFRDGMGIEVFYNGPDHEFMKFTTANYQLWKDLLAMGKRVFACSGGDEHACAEDTALTTLYAAERKNTAYLEQACKGNFTCGSVGIRMCIGDTVMGGQTDFAGKRLVVNVQDFHESVRIPERKYRLNIWDDTGIVESMDISCEEPVYVALDTQDRKFYRVDVIDVLRDRPVAIGNPIWNK